MKNPILWPSQSPDLNQLNTIRCITRHSPSPALKYKLSECFFGGIVFIALGLLQRCVQYMRRLTEAALVLHHFRSSAVPLIYNPSVHICFSVIVYYVYFHLAVSF